MTSPGAHALAPRSWSGLRRIRPTVLVAIALIVLLLIVGMSVSDRFGTARNLWNVYEQSTALALVSLGQTLVILTGGIDLSAGSMISLLSQLTSGFIDGDPARVAPVLAGVILLGVAIGALNGACIILLRVHPLIVTLGTGAVLQGLTLLYSSRPSGKVPPGFDEIAYGRLAGVPMGATAALALVLLTALFLRYAPFGRTVFAVGADENAARLMGLPRNRVLLFVYAFSGGCCALTAIFLVARFSTGQPYAGYNFTLSSITPVVVGGTLLSGGKGGVIGTLLGVYLIGLLYNVLNFVGIPTQWQLVVQGLVVILAVSVYVERRKIL
jgi:ribose transport system permease protein